MIMDKRAVDGFGTTARSLSRNPLGILALFIVLVYGLACLVVITGGSLRTLEILPIIYFIVIFPFVVLAVFTYLVAFRAGQLFAPGDFRKEETYLELQRMRLSAAASLAVASETKNRNRNMASNIEIEDIVRSVESVTSLAQEGSSNSVVLWVDDNPNNNLYERRALESMGIRFILSETTADALNLVSRQPFGAIISDMGRREGPREGYALLDALRAQDDYTPLFFYASSGSVEHRSETAQHGGQGCTNSGQELFEMVTKVIFNPQSRRGGSWKGFSRSSRKTK